MWAGAPPTKAQGASKRGGGHTLGQMGPKAHPRCASPSPPCGRHLDGIWGAAATPREGTLGGGAAPPLPLYILEVWAAQDTQVPLLLGAALPLSFSSYLAVLGEALLDHHAPPPPPRRWLLLDGVFLNLSLSPCWIKAWETS